jgi:ADP-ribose pyrophosphatase
VPEAATPRPWKRTRSGQEHDFTILRVREDRFADPRDGSEHPRVILTAPDWVNVVALTPERDALLVRQFRFGIEANSLEIPGGMVDEGETPAAAAARELEEETGFGAASWASLGVVHPNPALQSNRCHTYLALGCAPLPTGRAKTDEDIEVVRVPASRLEQLVQKGTITHALVVNAVYFAARVGALARE